MPKLCASWGVQGREEKDYTEGLKTKCSKGQATDTNGVTLRVGVKTALNDRLGRGHARSVISVQHWKVFTVSAFFFLFM